MPTKLLPWRKIARGFLQRAMPRTLTRLQARQRHRLRQRDLAELERRRQALLAGKSLLVRDPGWAVHHELTLRCNLHCDFCYQNDVRAEHEPREATLDELIALHDHVRPRRAVFVGSEVMLHPHFLDLLEALDRVGTELHVITNGTLLKEREAERLVALSNLASVILSIDGPPDVHDRLRGSTGTHAKTLRAALLLRGRVDLGLHCVLQAGNLSCAEAVLDLASELGIPSVHYGFLYAYGREEIEATYALLESRLGWSRDQVSLVVSERDDLGFDAAALDDCVRRLVAHGRAIGIAPVFAPPEFVEHLRAYVEGTLHETHRLVCRDRLHPEDLRLDPLGVIHPCAVIHKRLGSALEDDPRAVVDGDEARRFAELLETENLLPICRRCCRVAILSPHEEDSTS
ncbi:MAG: radical SAM protein [Planctomycetes bacterium]|nr:radical SAM protein [Planctomycetota bacterium]